MSNPIRFWSTKGYWGCFSNFSPHAVWINDKLYTTSEHAYQAFKAVTMIDHEKIRLAKTPKEAKSIAQTVKLVCGWELMKYDVMLHVLRHKTQQHATIKAKLLETGDAEIFEASPYDYVWGTGKDGTGANLLGKAWMQVRKEIKDATQNKE